MSGALEEYLRKQEFTPLLPQILRKRIEIPELKTTTIPGYWDTLHALYDSSIQSVAQIHSIPYTQLLKEEK